MKRYEGRTAGDWHQMPRLDGKGGLIVLDNKGRIVASTASDGRTTEECHANAALTADAPALLAQRDALQKQVERYEEELSECISPETVGGKSWEETLPDGTELPLMRGSPNLKAFIGFLHNCVAEREAQRDALLEAAKAVALSWRYDSMRRQEIDQLRVAIAACEKDSQ